jgi:predicted nucleic acid-binding protein
MLVVCDTSPLNYLVLIEAIDVLPILFNDVYVPPSVMLELAHPRAPVQVRQWSISPPSWLRVVGPMRIDPIFGLHLGETEAIALAQELKADALLVDERDATRIAIERGIPVVGTLAVLAKAIALGLIVQQQTVERLQETNFIGPIELIAPLVDRFKKQ